LVAGYIYDKLTKKHRREEIRIRHREEYYGRAGLVKVIEDAIEREKVEWITGIGGEMPEIISTFEGPFREAHCLALKLFDGMLRAGEPKEVPGCAKNAMKTALEQRSSPFTHAAVEIGLYRTSAWLHSYGR
jgi:hypothetical protein